MDIIVQLRAFAGFMISNTKVLIGVSLENSFLRMLRSLGWSIVNFEGNKQEKRLPHQISAKENA